MIDEFVIGFMSDDPEGLTAIDIVMDATRLTYDEVKSCYETVKIDDNYECIDQY